MLPVNSRHTVINSLVPDNPKPGQVVTMPEGQVLGASHVISLLKNTDVIGDAMQIAPVVNVTGKSVMSRVTTCVPLRKGMRIRVLAQQFSFKSAIFIQYFGWMGHDVIDNVVVITDKIYKIEYALRVGPPSEKFFVYEKVCLTTVEEKP
jgi:hypothetical protein